MKTVYSILTILLLLFAPLIGAQWAGLDVAEYLQFPPMNVSPIDHPGFSWVVFSILLLIILLVIFPFIYRIFTAKKRKPEPTPSRYGFPGWGWAGLIIMLLGWVLAWTRFSWMEAFQRYTFSIPWLGYILLINALTWYRSGRSLLTHNTRYLLVLFLASAIFWWYFEYLNQFVVNWYYVNTGDLSSWSFFWYATIPFSTVLPAVISTRDYLRTFNGLSNGLGNFIKVRIPYHNLLSHITLIITALALNALPVYPDYLFPLLWLGPLAIFTAAMKLAGRRTIFAGVSRGQWREVFLLALAALVCGFFWEMWNFYSLARWEYSIPFVDRFHIFEMPVLGYAGYLPFGLQCGIIANWIKEWVK